MPYLLTEFHPAHNGAAKDMRCGGVRHKTLKSSGIIRQIGHRFSPAARPHRESKRREAADEGRRAVRGLVDFLLPVVEADRLAPRIRQL